MKALKTGLAIAIVVAGCGPAITETRMGYAEPKPESCDVKVVNVQAMTLMTNPDYEHLGMIASQSSSHQDPFNEEMLSELRPRVCKMGGDHISLGMASNVSRGGSAVIYNVLKKKGGGTSDAPTSGEPPATPGETTPADATPKP